MDFTEIAMGTPETVSFTAGDCVVAHTITLTPDDLFEDIECFEVVIATPGGTNAAKASVNPVLNIAHVFILDTSVKYWIDPVYVFKECDGAVEVFVHRDGYLGHPDDEVAIYTTAVSASTMDFTEIAMGTPDTVSFTAGDCVVAHTITLTPDDLFEDIECFEVVIATPGGTNAAKASVNPVLNIAHVFILDTSVKYWIDPVYVFKECDGAVEVFVHRDGYLGHPDDEVAIYTTAVSASTMDFTEIAMGTPDTVSFTAGDCVVAHTITLTPDDLFEDIECFEVVIATPGGTNAAKASVNPVLNIAHVFILDTSVKYWIDPVYVFKECDGAVEVFVHRDGYLGHPDDEVAIYTTAVSASTMDFTEIAMGTPDTVSFTAGDCVVAHTITLTPDDLFEDIECFEVVIATPGGTNAAKASVNPVLNIAHVFILDTSVKYWIDPVYVFKECDGAVEVFVHRDGYLGHPDDEVAIYTTAVSASTMDFTEIAMGTPDTVSFTAGDCVVAHTITLTPDDLFEDIECFEVVIATPGGTNAAKASVNPVLNIAHVFILDTSVKYWIDPVYVFKECDGAVEVFVHRDGYLGHPDDEVAIYTTAVSASTMDFTEIAMGTPDTVSFTAGDCVVAHTITLTPDDLFEDIECFEVVIATPGGTNAAKASVNPVLNIAHVFILDTSVKYWIDPVYVFKECDGAVEVFVHRDGYLGHPDDEVAIYTTAVSASTMDFTEIAMGTPDTVSFTAGDCVVAHTITLTPDDLFEDIECFEVVIATPGGTNAAKASVNPVLNIAHVFILDTSVKYWIDPVYVFKECDGAVEVFVHRDGYLGHPDDEVAIYTTAVSASTMDFTEIAMGTPDTVSFTAGDCVVAHTITLTPDDLFEDIECFEVVIATPGGTNAAKASVNPVLNIAHVFILDTSVKYWIDPVYIFDECDGTVEVFVHREGFLGNTDDQVDIYTTAVSATTTDFTEILMGTPDKVSFIAGDCVVAHSITLTPDALVEGIEYFEVVITTPGGTNAAKASVNPVLNTAKVFILDHSTIIWIDSTYTGEEGSMVKLQVHRFGNVGQDTSVAITLTPQTAVVGDYADIGGATTIDFAEGEIVQELLLDLETDALVEGIEYFQAVLGAVTVADPTKTTVDPMLNTANIFILDLTSYFWIEEKQFIAFEETTLPVTFHRGGYLGRTDVIEVTYTDARATDPEDYAPVGDATITFNDDETTATKMIDIEPDNILEYNEMFFLEIEIPAGSTLLDTARLDSPSVSEVIIKDPTWYVFDCADFTVIESTGEVNIIIVRKEISEPRDMSVANLTRFYVPVDCPYIIGIGTRDRLTPVELTASSDTDFTPIDMQVDFDPGQSVETVTIDITHDTLVEGDEQFQVYLYDPDTAEALGDLHKAIVTIYDDDDSSTYSFRRVVHHVTESSGSVIITLLRDGPLVSDTDGSVDISTVDGVDYRFLTAEDGTDFVGFESETIKFPAGNRIVHHTISLADGVDVDKQEYFEVCMSNPTFGTIDPPECAIVYIEDDDSVFGFDKPVYYVKEDSSVTVNIVRLGCLKVRGSVAEVIFGDVTYTVNEGVGVVTVKVVRRGYLNNIVSVGQAVGHLEDPPASDQTRGQLNNLFAPDQASLDVEIKCSEMNSSKRFCRIPFFASSDTSADPDSSMDCLYSATQSGDAASEHLLLTSLQSLLRADNDVVSSDVNAKAGATKDYIDVLHTVVFGAGDDPQENMVCFDIIVNDDDVVEHLETFHLELQNINNGLIGEPRIAEVFIEDNDVTYSLDSTKICGSEADGEVKFTVTRDGNLNEETSIDIFTRDISASSSEPNQDYLPLLEELSHNVIFAPGETSKTVTIDIVDDTFYELPEEFEVILASDIAAQLSAPSSAVVTIISDDITCALDCRNGGFCVGPDECQCPDGYTGKFCDDDKNECELNPPMCIGNNIECFNKVGTYKCICTDPEYMLEGNRCVRETKTFIGRIYADELDGLPLQFVREMYDPDSQEFKNLADIVETQLRNILPPAVDGFDDVSVARIFPTSDGHVGVVFETSVAAASRTDATDIDTLVAGSITPDGYLGDSTLRIAKPIEQGQYARSIEGIFYASNGEEFDPRLLDTNSPEFLQFASEVNPALAPIFHDLEGLQGPPRVKEVYPLGDMIGVVYEVPVASTSPATVSDVDEVFARTTGLSGYLGNTDLLLLSIGDRCPSSFCANGGVCTVQADFTFSCICDAGVSGGRCQGINGTGNTANGITTHGWIALGYGVGCSALAALLAALCCIYCRMGRVGRTNIPFDIEPPLPSYVVRDPYIEVEGPSQLILDTPLESIYRTTGQLTPAFPSLLVIGQLPTAFPSLLVNKHYYSHSIGQLPTAFPSLLGTFHYQSVSISSTIVHDLTIGFQVSTQQRDKLIVVLLIQEEGLLVMNMANTGTVNDAYVDV
ncbi:uncharacterized protein [Amphiura filiformis]|uniref:uncharacterized protein n=1 Tax=Amphiura filiformis TaxID=82378 RepID=UPI003B20F2E6